MGELLSDVATYGFSTLVGAALLCGFCPVLVLRLLLLLYPSGHERRLEWLKEIKHVPWRERLIWVASLIPTALFEGLPARLRARHGHLPSIDNTAFIVDIRNLNEHDLDEFVNSLDRELLVKLADGKSMTLVGQQVMRGGKLCTLFRTQRGEERVYYGPQKRLAP